MLRLLLSLVVLISFSLPAWAAEKESAFDRVMRTGVLKVGYFVWPPYVIKDPNTDELSGLSPDYMEIVASFLDLKVEWVPMAALGTQVEDFRQARYDVVISDGPYVFSAIKFIDFSNPLFYAPVYAYGRDGENKFKTSDDLNLPETKFIGLDGDLSIDLVQRLYPKANLATLPAGTDPGQMMLNVTMKKADVVILDPGSVVTFNVNNKPGLTALFPETPVAIYPVGFSMMKDDGKLLTTINGAVAALHNTNSMSPILKKWFPDKGSVFEVSKPYEVPK